MILMTGSTGYLGKRLVRDLLDRGHELVLIVRKQSIKAAQKTFEGLNGIRIVEGDLSASDILTGEKTKEDDLSFIQKNVDTVIHIAAVYDIEASFDKSYINNVIGTQNVIFFCDNLPNLKVFHYTSTIAVSGNFEGQFPEDQLDFGQDFDDNYAKTKFIAEVLVRNWKSDKIKKRIYRPGMIVGHSKTGQLDKKEDGPYFLLKYLNEHPSLRKFIDRAKIVPLPFSADTKLPLITVDQCSEVLADIVTKDNCDKKVRTYHLVGREGGVKMSDFLTETFKAFGIEAKAMALPENKVNQLIVKQIGLPKESLSYMYSKSEFHPSNIEKDYPELKMLSFSEYKDALFNYVDQTTIG